jgi:hypothetical protein
MSKSTSFTWVFIVLSLLPKRLVVKGLLSLDLAPSVVLPPSPKGEFWAKSGCRNNSDERAMVRSLAIVMMVESVLFI